MADLGVLRTGKLALDEGLISPEQYNEITVAFVKAQQIKAGLDAGFLTQQEFEGTREAFLTALAIGGGSSSGPRVSSAPRVEPAAAPAKTAPVANVSNNAVRPSVSNPISRPAVTEQPRPGRHTVGQPSKPEPQAFTSSPAEASKLEKKLSSSSPGSGTVTVDISSLPKLAPVNVVGKKSMAGISVAEDCLHLYNNMKTKSTFKWATFRINDAGQEVIIENVGSPQSSYEDFVAALPDNLCRYGVYDYLYTKSDTNTTIQKLVFINWAPTSSPIRAKMMYASTKDFFKGFMDGIGAELQATEVSELSEEEMQEKVAFGMTRR